MFKMQNEAIEVKKNNASVLILKQKKSKLPTSISSVNNIYIKFSAIEFTYFSSQSSSHVSLHVIPF